VQFLLGKVRRSRVADMHLPSRDQWRAGFKAFVSSWLAAHGAAVIRPSGRYHQDGLYTVHSDHFRQDSTFREAYGRGIQASEGVDPGIEWRVHIAIWAARAALRVPGDFVECGVNAGFISSAIMKALDWNAIGRRFYLVDTFEGPVLAQFSSGEQTAGRLEIARRAIEAGEYVCDIQRVRANFADWPNAIIVQGAVPEVLGTLHCDSVAFAHLDMNCAFPEVQAFEFVWERLYPGGIVLLDDYGYFGHDIQRQSLDTAAEKRGAVILSLPTGQGMIMR
jgi:hypothetical protein